MDSNVSTMVDIIENIKHKIRDNDYKKLLETLTKINSDLSKQKTVRINPIVTHINPGTYMNDVLIPAIRNDFEPQSNLIPFRSLSIGYFD